MERYDDLIMELGRGEERVNEAGGAFPIPIPTSVRAVQVEMNIVWKVEKLRIHISPGGAASVAERGVVEKLAAMKIAPFDYQILFRSGNGGHSIFHQLFSDVLVSMGVKPPHVQDDIIGGIVEFLRGAVPREWGSAGTRIFPLRVTFTARTMHVSSSDSDDREKGTMIPATTELKRVRRLEDDEKCVICLEEMVEATAMPCSHLFHGSCITAWLEQSHLCPLCRFQMP